MTKGNSVVARRQERALTAWSEKISAAWNKTLDGILEAGRLLIEAKEQLEHGQFGILVEKSLPFQPRTAQMLMKIAGHPRIANAIHGSLLPPYYRTLYDLTKLDDGAWALAMERGIIRPDMERKDLSPLLIECRRKRNQPQPAPAVETCTVDDLHTLIAAGMKFGTIYADPPWLYDNQATRAATGNHYDTMTVEKICDLPVRQLAADDAHLHLWTTNGFLFDAPRIFDAWGFEFRSSFIWCKSEMGIGNYWRNAHEILLTAIRGNAKRFADRGIMSWLECSRGRHSAKPEQVRGFIERASPGPRLELFARAPAEGWAVWGDGIERGLLHQHVQEFAA